MGMSTADTKGQNGRHGDTTAPGGGGGESAYFWMNKAIAKKRARMNRGNFLRCTIKKSQKDKKTSIFFITVIAFSSYELLQPKFLSPFSLTTKTNMK